VHSKLLFQVSLLLAGFHATVCGAEEVLFRDDFRGKLAEGWSWRREDRAGWRVTKQGLEMRVQPGNMWGPSNNARNVLVRPLPEPISEEIEISVTVSNRPTEQYEQVDLVWYYDDSHMVKLGQELVDGKLSLVLGREEQDQTRTIALLPLDAFSVRLRFVAQGNRIRGEYRLPGQAKWLRAGECDLPVNGPPKASLQVYQGPKTTERWARFTEFRVTRPGPIKLRAGTVP
jgi:regulation of enolase protein 1 (concanavalin A-like superfamily)